MKYVKFDFTFTSRITYNRGSRRVEKFLQESILIAFDFILEVLLSDRSFATLLDPPLYNINVLYLHL